MNKIILLVIWCFTLTVDSFAQPDTAIIERIDRTIKSLSENIASFTKIEKYRDSISYRDEFYHEGTLQLIKVFYNDSGIHKNVSWYFNQAELIYSEQIWSNSLTNEVVCRDKFYFNNYTLLAWIKANNEFVDHHSDEFNAVDQEFRKSIQNHIIDFH